MQPDALFHTVAQVMIGEFSKLLMEEMANESTTFMISECGWTLFLSSINVSDPASVDPK